MDYSIHNLKFRRKKISKIAHIAVVNWKSSKLRLYIPFKKMNEVIDLWKLKKMVKFEWTEDLFCFFFSNAKCKSNASQVAKP